MGTGTDSDPSFPRGAKVNMADTPKVRTSSSLVTDVLAKTDRLEKENLQTCMKKMVQRANAVKVSFPPL